MSAGHAVLVAATLGVFVSLGALHAEVQRMRVPAGVLVYRVVQPGLMVWYASLRNGVFSGAGG